MLEHSMSQSFLLKKLRLNLQLDQLPTVENEYLLEIIKTETLPKFSDFFPLVIDDVIVETSEDNRAPDYPSTYYIYDKDNNYFGKDVLILGIMEVNAGKKNSYNVGFNTMGLDTCNFGNSMVGIMNGIGMSGVTSLLNSGSIAGTHEFLPPNKIRLFRTVKGMKLYLKLFCTHPDNLSTIPHTKLEAFYKLAEADVKRILYERFKRYKNVDTAYGQIDLMIDGWEDSDGSKRDEIIQDMHEKYLLDNQGKVFAF